MNSKVFKFMKKWSILQDELRNVVTAYNNNNNNNKDR